MNRLLATEPTYIWATVIIYNQLSKNEVLPHEEIHFPASGPAYAPADSPAAGICQVCRCGRFDGRVTGPVTTGDLGDGESDPSSASGDIAFPVAVNEYITDELGFQTDRPYVVQSDEVNKKWKFGLDNQSISQENTIYEAMSKNPFLKVWVLCGYYDAATPFYAAEWVYDHVFINDSLQNNISFTYYPSGHMIYVDADSLVQLHQDAEAWFGRE